MCGIVESLDPDTIPTKFYIIISISTRNIENLLHNNEQNTKQTKNTLITVPTTSTSIEVVAFIIIFYCSVDGVGIP